LRCPAQAVAHHPRLSGATWRARVARLLSRPSRRCRRPDPAARHLSAFPEVMGPLPVHVSAATPAGRYARSGKRAPRDGGRLSAAACCGEPTIPGSPGVTAARPARLSEPWQRDHAGADARVIAFVEHTRLPRPSWNFGVTAVRCDGYTVRAAASSWIVVWRVWSRCRRRSCSILTARLARPR